MVDEIEAADALLAGELRARIRAYGFDELLDMLAHQ
jgi:hypothetical protein